MSESRNPSLLVISQVYVPDPASVGQHMADAAEAMAGRGYDVRVLASSRGYENSKVKYARKERRCGVDITRLPFSSFGKRTLAHRVLGQGLFLLQVIVRGLFARRLAGVLVSTSPPMASFAAVVIGFVRGVPITYWLMDMNPDQAIAMGKVSTKSPLVAAMRWLNRRVFARAANVVVLDRFMAERVHAQYGVHGRMEVVPPWPHVAAAMPDKETRRQGDKEQPLSPPIENPFITEHGLAGKFVVMYSGNHSLASPVTTLVQAALQMQDDPRVVFMFIGGGLGKRAVDEAIESHRPANILSLPYQPLERLLYSLSAADLHIVTVGNGMVGIIHPCKIYGAMAVGRPVLLVGPRPSHAADLIERHKCGWRIDHGDVAGATAMLRQIASTPRAELAAMGERARDAACQHYSKERLCAEFCDIIERGMAPVKYGGAPQPNLQQSESARQASCWKPQL
jgi:colanic acid biosynthesis glycosyl transferase WcaI